MSEGTKNGLVGFFDILGYQNLLEQNEPEVVAEAVLPILFDLKNQTNARFEKAMKGSTNKKIIDISKKIEWLVFSDTILLTLDFNENDALVNNNRYWGVFLFASIDIQERLFNAGLPVRGAIDYGKFFIQESCFAGRSIVNAYKLSSAIEMAACVLSDKVLKEFDRSEEAEKKVARPPVLKDLLVPYLVPTKQGETPMHVLNARLASNPDIHKKVMHAFWGYRKEIAQNVRPKIANTEQWLEFLDFKKSQRK